MSTSTDRMRQLQLDKRLRQLAIAAQEQPKGSAARQRALTELISAILQSRKLCRPRRGQFRVLYEEIYAEALQRLFLFVCDRIDDYSIQKGEVLQWANFLLKRRFFIEASRDYLPAVYKGMDARSVKRLTLEQLDQNSPADLNPQLVPLLSQEIIDCLKEDPDGLFQGAYITDRPTANFQYLALKKIEGYAWKELSAEFDIPVPTLSSFYRRSLARFASTLKGYLS